MGVSLASAADPAMVAARHCFSCSGGSRDIGVASTAPGYSLAASLAWSSPPWA